MQQMISDATREQPEPFAPCLCGEPTGADGICPDPECPCMVKRALDEGIINEQDADYLDEGMAEGRLSSEDVARSLCARRQLKREKLLHVPASRPTRTIRVLGELHAEHHAQASIQPKMVSSRGLHLNSATLDNGHTHAEVTLWADGHAEVEITRDGIVVLATLPPEHE
jgi:hypothetical protein